MTCNQLQRYTGNESNEAFRVHVKHCRTCAKRLTEIEVLEYEIAAMARDENLQFKKSHPTARQALLDQAYCQHPPKVWGLWIGVPAAAVAVLVLCWMSFDSLSRLVLPAKVDSTAALITSVTEKPAPTQGKQSELSSSAKQFWAATDTPKQFSLGKHRIGLAETGKLQLTQFNNQTVSMQLVEGLVACQVAFQKPAGRFSITHGDYTVVVVGTRFSVTSDNQHLLLVSVKSGTVKVTGPGQWSQTVLAGETLAIKKEGPAQLKPIDELAQKTIELLLPQELRPAETDEITNTQRTTGTKETLSRTASTSQVLPEPELEQEAEWSTPSKQVRRQSTVLKPISPQKPQFNQWKQLVIKGRFQDAERQLTQHLKQQPSDADAWRLLATCRRKMGNWNGAVAAYQKVISTGTGTRKDNARFRIATILQDKLGRHEQALKYLDRYLKNGIHQKPLRAEALTRQGKSLIALGRNKTAKQVLEKVVQENKGQASSIKAEQMLETIR